MIYIIIGIIILLTILYFIYEDNVLKVTKYNLTSKKIKGDFKIIQISDFHNLRSKYLHNQIVKTINKEKPNIIVITGDLIDKDDNKYASILINKIKKMSKIYYISGNHECIFGGYNDLKQMLIKNNVTVLDNEYISINDDIDLYGIKDPSFDLPNDEDIITKQYLNNFNINEKKYSILLSHRPEKYNIYVDKKFDLVFTGHAHGGQWILPIIGPIFSPHQGMFPKYARGIHKKNNTSMIVSRGLGNSLNACIRINNRPELVIVSLSK